jgi:LysM repeat protein
MVRGARLYPSFAGVDPAGIAGGSAISSLIVGLIEMIQARHIAAILIAACLGGAATTATAAEPHGRAYLFRGLIGMIDWGMDELAGRINRTGVQANIDAHLMWRSMADQAISDYRRDPKPITAIGHSIGGDTAVEFAERLEAAHVPVSLLVTYDPNRFAHNIPANVHRYINLYQSENVLGGGDLAPARGFHGNYASFNLKNRSEVIHVNLDKFPHIQEILASKIRSAGAISEGREPLRLVVPANVPIELWDSGLPIAARAGDTLHTIATTYHVPLWALTQINKVSESAALTEGQRIVIPHSVGQKLPSSDAAGEKLPSNPTQNPVSSEAPSEKLP